MTQYFVNGMFYLFALDYLWLSWLFSSQSDKLQEQQDLIAELQCQLSTQGLMGLGLNLRSRPHTAPMGSMQHGQNGGTYRQVTNQQSWFSDCDFSGLTDKAVIHACLFLSGNST